MKRNAEVAEKIEAEYAEPCGPREAKLAARKPTYSDLYPPPIEPLKPEDLVRVPACPLCGDEMVKDRSEANPAMIAGGILLLLIGLPTIIVPLIGWFVGPLLCILAIVMIAKRNRVWRCVNCQSIAPRA